MPHAMQDHPTTPFTPASIPAASLGQGDHERLFHLLDTEGPAPDDFMLFLSDPLLERENIFEDFEGEGES